MKTSELKNPHQRALVPLAGLVSFSLMTILAMGGLSLAGYANPGLIWIGLIFLAFFALMWVVIWLLGVRQVQRARAFLGSDRPLARWTYTTAEWQQLKEALWQEEKSDWKIQWGCLTFLLALAGLLTGILLGLDGDFIDVIVNGLGGLVTGGMAGAAIGVFVAGGNYLAARQAYHQPNPGQVALGVNEIYVVNDYFKGDGTSSYILEAEISRGNPSTLKLQLLFPPRPRMPRQEEWIIPLPPQWVEPVAENLPRLAPKRQLE